MLISKDLKEWGNIFKIYLNPNLIWFSNYFSFLGMLKFVFKKITKIIIQNHTKQKKHSIYYVIYLYIFQFHEKKSSPFLFLARNTLLAGIRLGIRAWTWTTWRTTTRGIRTWIRSLTRTFFQINAISNSSQLRHLFLESFVPFFA